MLPSSYYWVAIIRGWHIGHTMAQTATQNPARKISISLPINYIEKLDEMNGTRSKIIRESLEQLFDQNKIEYMGYFFNAIHGQISQSKVMSSLTKSSIEKYLRSCIGVSPEEDLWDIVPTKVRNWCHAFILPLEDSVSILTDDERIALMKLAKSRLWKLLEWENSRGYC